MIILRKILRKKETKHIHASDVDLLHTVLAQDISIGANARSSHWKCSVVFFKISQNSQEIPVPEETPVNFAKILRTPFLQNNSERLLLKCGHYKNEAREIDCLCCREVDAMLLPSAKILECEGSISLFNFYGDLPDYQSPLLALYTGYMSYSFSFWCS